MIVYLMRIMYAAIFKIRIEINIQNLGVYIQSVPGGKDLTSGECSLGQTIPK
jgi:hypothetical protein